MISMSKNYEQAQIVAVRKSKDSDLRTKSLLLQIEPKIARALSLTKESGTTSELNLLFRSDCPHINCELIHHDKETILAEDKSSEEKISAEVDMSLARSVALDRIGKVISELRDRIKSEANVCSVHLTLKFKKAKLHARTEVINTVF